jgi:hypothetical protein
MPLETCPCRCRPLVTATVECPSRRIKVEYFPQTSRVGLTLKRAFHEAGLVRLDFGDHRGLRFDGLRGVHKRQPALPWPEAMPMSAPETACMLADTRGIFSE